MSRSIDQQGGQVDPCPQIKLGRTAEEAVAEARLFEAAPKLLEACEAALEHYVKTTDGPRMYAMLRAAIAAAKG